MLWSLSNTINGIHASRIIRFTMAILPKDGDNDRASDTELHKAQWSTKCAVNMLFD